MDDTTFTSLSRSEIKTIKEDIAAIKGKVIANEYEQKDFRRSMIHLEIRQNRYIDSVGDRIVRDFNAIWQDQIQKQAERIERIEEHLGITP